jgi:TetR/AcrR family transcriptional regulator
MRDRILAVAIRLFARHGFDGVSVRDVASAAGVTMPTLYHHFGDKRSLYLESCLSLFERWGLRLSHLLQQTGTPQQRLFDYFSALGASLISDRQLSALLQRELLERDATGIRKLTRSTFSVHFREVTELCRLLQGHTGMELTAHTLFALAFGLAQLRPIGRELGVISRIASAEQLARHLLGVALPGHSWSRLRARPVRPAAI